MTFRLAYVPGVTPAKWVRTWRERVPEVPLTLVRVTAADAEAAVRRGEADAALLRLPVDREGLHAIPLYIEATVVIVPKDHFLAAAEELSEKDLAEDVVLHPFDDVLEWTEPLPGRPAIERPVTTEDAVELVSAGVGLLVAPQSLARLHHRKDLTYRPLPTAPTSQVALSWPAGETSELMEQFIGIVRGRTVNSSRGSQPAEKAKAAERGGQPPAKAAERRKPTAGAGRQRSTGAPKGRGKPRRRG
ncbi:LysR family substrate-binding domain-containing protein [Kutzneria sp. CA-103260]|uniref:LysR family substrate-binding domain-containing protein n=1 Tax=Kutzneria sp. CA-103260 TaxID=2802641 RepID=UPI001BF0D889|nr:LysR family substrate-binding domain-containing protein [Kutzneria sp. CA-103260]QUQ63199.1 LysR family transcriptional regulator [Kutzneria sp. CA-103260]